MTERERVSEGEGGYTYRAAINQRISWVLHGLLARMAVVARKAFDQRSVSGGSSADTKKKTDD